MHELTTHPAAGAQNIPAGLPTPWPLPTPSQRQRSALFQGGEEEASVAGDPIAPPLYGAISGGVNQVLQRLASLEDENRLAESRQALTEMLSQLEKSQVPVRAHQIIASFFDNVNSNRNREAQSDAQSLIASHWTKASRVWLTALKRIAAKNFTPSPPNPSGYPPRM